MANILIITTELTSLKGLPTGGRGVRVQNLADGLKSHNHNVIMSFLNDSISRIETIGKISVPEEFKKYGHNYCYDKIISKVRPDIIIFSPWMLAISYDAKKFKTIPVVLDMPGMITLENIYDKMENDFDFLAKKIHTFNKSDLFCVSNQRQKYYLYSLLLMSGIDINEKSVILSPISYTDNIPEHKKYPSPPTYIFSGVLWNWQNYGDSLSNIAGYLAKNGGEFEIYCGNFLYAETSRSLNELKRFESVKLNGLIEHDALLQKYIQSSVAVELYLPNPERELATTTRTLEYIWSGLPVIYSKGMYLAEFIKEYDAGWVIDPLDSDELLKVLNEINLRPEICAEKGANAQKLLKERFNNYSAVQELSDFCDNPRKLNNVDTFISVLCGETLQKTEEIKYYKNTLFPQLENKDKEISDLNREKNNLIDKSSFYENEIVRLNNEKFEILNDLNRIKNRVVFRILLRMKKILELFRDLVLLRKV